MASKINKGEILAKFFDDGEYTALFADGAVSAACGYAAGQQAYAVYQNGEAVTVKDVEKNIKVLEMAAQTGCPVVTFYDSVGNVVEPNETMIAMMHAAADQIDHAIFDFQIIVVNGQRYFAFVKLNVNWWDPCTLYEYEGGELRELAQWDNMRLLSIGFI